MILMRIENFEFEICKFSAYIEIINRSKIVYNSNKLDQERNIDLSKMKYSKYPNIWGFNKK